MQDFLWGAATSSHQVEGGNVHSDWWLWEHQGNIEGGVTSGNACDHWNHYVQDLQRAKSLGLTSYRFSVEWARVEPAEGQFAETVLQHYSDMVVECEKQGLVPMVTLHHFTLPQWLAAKGGFENDKVSDFFARYTERIWEKFGRRIPLWCTINEPIVLTVGGYLGKFMPPSVFDPKRASKVLRNLLLCHVKAFDFLDGRRFQRNGRFVTIPTAIGFAHNMIDWKADRRMHPIEECFARVFHCFYNKSWLDAVTGKRQSFGIPGLIPKIKPVSEAIGRVTTDYVGINYYTRGYVQWWPRSSMRERIDALPIGIRFAKPHQQKSDLDWRVCPQGFENVIRFVSKNYKLPIFITENGIADRDDNLRPEFIESHIGVIKKLKKEGLDIRGYYHWSLLDNFEWVKGFWPRFGLFKVDYETMQREETASARLYSQIIKKGF